MPPISWEWEAARIIIGRISLIHLHDAASLFCLPALIRVQQPCRTYQVIQFTATMRSSFILACILMIFLGVALLISGGKAVVKVADGLSASVRTGREWLPYVQTQAVDSASDGQCPPIFTFDSRSNHLRHYHSHKAGGKTLNFILSKAQMASGSSEDGGSLFSRKGGEIHGGRKSLNSYLDSSSNSSNARYVTFLREPSSKVMSRFYYHRAMCDGSDWLQPSFKAIGVCCLSLEDYVKKRAMNNNQYEGLVAGQPTGKECAGTDDSNREAPTVFEDEWEIIRRGKLTPQDVCPGGGRDGLIRRIEDILSDLSDTVFFGIVERWDESIFLLGQEGGFDLRSLAYCRKNSRSSPGPAALRDGEWGYAGKEALAALIEYNALDEAVYQAAVRLLDRKVACFEMVSPSKKSVALYTKQWQDEVLVPFQDANNCHIQKKKPYNPTVRGVPDGKIVDPGFFVPDDVPIFVGQANRGGNRTCPELLQAYPKCPKRMSKYLEPC